MKLFIIRHGDPDYEHDTLTERGWAEAHLLCDRLMKEQITKVYVSPLGRAQATAKPFLEASGLTAETKDFLQEFPRPVFQRLGAFGKEDRLSCAWDLEPALFMANQAQFSDAERWSEHPMYNEYGCAEGARYVRAQLDALLDEVGLTREGILYRENERFESGQNIALFCHMGLGSLLLAHLSFMAPPLFWQMFRFQPTSVSTVLFIPVGGGMRQSKIFSVGDTTHLAPIGLTYRG